MDSSAAINVLSLCSGVGAIDLGVLLACPGARTRCFVEIEPYCQRVLEQRMRDGIFEPAGVWDDLRTFDGNEWRGRIGIVVAGFPCQDISIAGCGAGIDGERSGLFFEAMRIVREVRPALVFLENTSTLTSRGLDRVLGELAEAGFDAEWMCVRASGVGASMQRERIFILAHDRKTGLQGSELEAICGTGTPPPSRGISCRISWSTLSSRTIGRRSIRSRAR